MAAIEDLEVIAQQEALLRFPSFHSETAWQLGSLLRTMLLERNAGGTVEIELAGQVLFACTTPGATPGQANWVRRKRNTVRAFAKSSYAVGLTLERDGDTLPVRQGLCRVHRRLRRGWEQERGSCPLWPRSRRHLY